MSVHEDLLNNGENNCSFTEDEVDIMCSKDGDDACRDLCVAMQSRYLEILDFTQFFDHFVFTPNAENVLDRYRKIQK